MRKIKTWDQMVKEVKNRTIIIEGLSMPLNLAGGYTPAKVYPLSDLENYKLHRRMKVFYNKGLKCVKCPAEGVHLILGVDPTNGEHINLYTSDFVLAQLPVCSTG